MSTTTFLKSYMIAVRLYHVLNQRMGQSTVSRVERTKSSYMNYLRLKIANALHAPARWEKLKESMKEKIWRTSKHLRTSTPWTRLSQSLQFALVRNSQYGRLPCSKVAMKPTTCAREDEVGITRLRQSGCLKLSGIVKGTEFGRNGIVAACTHEQTTARPGLLIELGFHSFHEFGLSGDVQVVDPGLHARGHHGLAIFPVGPHTVEQQSRPLAHGG